MISVVTGTIGVTVAVLILVLIRRDQLHVNHGLGWILVAAAFALAGLFPRVIDAAAGSVGVAYPPVLALTIAVAVLVIKILLMDIERSRLETRHQRMIQRIAMLEADLRNMKRTGGQPCQRPSTPE